MEQVTQQVQDGAFSLWLEEARLEAILGGCKKSVKSLLSGVRCYIAFIGVACFVARVSHVHLALLTDERDKKLRADVSPRYFPPKLDDLLAWSTLFRCKGTFENYCSHLATACLVVGAAVSVFNEPALKKAKASIVKAGGFTARPKMWVRRSVSSYP